MQHLAIALAALAAGQEGGAPSELEAWSSGRCLRVEWIHCGTAEEEHLVLQGQRLEGEWPGPRGGLVDRSGLGKYRVVLREPDTGRVLYAEGYASIFGEWETTGEARERWGAFRESRRVPEPRAPVQLVVEKRGADGLFHELASELVDPAARAVERSAVPARGTLRALDEGGPAGTRVDLLFLSGGYVEAERFFADAERAAAALFALEPYRSRRADFAVRALFVPAPEQGISKPRQGAWRADPFGLSYDAFGSERYVLAFDDRALREAAAQAPYDALVILVDERKYGGGGIYGLWCIAAARSSEAGYLVVHELGHSFAGLGDEYYSSQVAYEEFTPPGVEPWEPNVTALSDPARLKWRDLVDEGTPLPTPWDQAGYDEVDRAWQDRRAALREAGAAEEELEALFAAQRASSAPRLAAEEHAGRVGAFEGASYRAKGLYRPEVDCLMFTRDPVGFCGVCRRAIERAIDRAVGRPLDRSAR
jgi:hypothetical protein